MKLQMLLRFLQKYIKSRYFLASINHILKKCFSLFQLCSKKVIILHKRRQDMIYFLHFDYRSNFFVAFNRLFNQHLPLGVFVNLGLIIRQHPARHRQRLPLPARLIRFFRIGGALSIFTLLTKCLR